MHVVPGKDKTNSATSGVPAITNSKANTILSSLHGRRSSSVWVSIIDSKLLQDCLIEMFIVARLNLSTDYILYAHLLKQSSKTGKKAAGKVSHEYFNKLCSTFSLSSKNCCASCNHEWKITVCFLTHIKRGKPVTIALAASLLLRWMAVTFAYALKVLYNNWILRAVDAVQKDIEYFDNKYTPTLIIADWAVTVCNDYLSFMIFTQGIYHRNLCVILS